MAEHATRILGEHRYALTSIWTGNTGTGTSGYRDYRRDVEISVEESQCSSHPPTSLSAATPRDGTPRTSSSQRCRNATCSYLHACVTAGVVVLSYRDDATGTMREDGAGGGAFSEVTLHPQVVVADASMIEAAERARAGQRVVLHRELDELPRAARGHGDRPRLSARRPSATLVRQSLLDLLDRSLRGSFVVCPGELLARERVDRGHDLVGRETTRSTARRRTVRGEIEGFAESHRDSLLRRGDLRADRHHLVGSDEPDGDDGRSGLQSQEGDARAALVEPTVGGTGASG